MNGIDLGWDEAIERSKFFIAIINKTFFDDAICVCQAQHAKDLKKPFIFLLEKGVEIPVDFLDGIENYRIAEWEHSEDIISIFCKLPTDHADMDRELP